MEELISKKAIELKINPKHLEISKSFENGYYVKLKYNRGKQELLNGFIQREQLRTQLKGVKKVKKDHIIRSIMSINKLLPEGKKVIIKTKKIIK